MRSRGWVGAGWIFGTIAWLFIPMGCGQKNEASRVQSPPPPMLRAPVEKGADEREVERSAPAMQVVPADEYAFLNGSKTQVSSTPLPKVEAPAPSSVTSTKAETVSLANGSSVEKDKFYVMQKGDTLYGVARKFNVEPKKLISINTNLSNPNHVPIGTRVRIP